LLVLGAILAFPMLIRGGLFYLGDCPAAQGDGELSGVAIERCATVSLPVDTVKDWTLPGRRVSRKAFS
jgi:acetamidase/formamidase